jgi:hypothetical protein
MSCDDSASCMLCSICIVTRNAHFVPDIVVVPAGAHLFKIFSTLEWGVLRKGAAGARMEVGIAVGLVTTGFMGFVVSPM